MIEGQTAEHRKAERLAEEAKLLIARLERISADSIWAHRSSGLRGELLRWIDRIEMAAPAVERQSVEPNIELERLDVLINAGFQMLEKAAKELIT